MYNLEVKNNCDEDLWVQKVKIGKMLNIYSFKADLLPSLLVPLWSFPTQKLPLITSGPCQWGTKITNKGGTQSKNNVIINAESNLWDLMLRDPFNGYIWKLFHRFQLYFLKHFHHESFFSEKPNHNLCGSLPPGPKQINKYIKCVSSTWSHSTF